MADPGDSNATEQKQDPASPELLLWTEIAPEAQGPTIPAVPLVHEHRDFWVNND